MSKKKSDSSDEGKSIWRNPLVLAAIFTLLGSVITGLITRDQTIKQITIPIEATAEAQATQLAVLALTPTQDPSSLQPTQVGTEEATSTDNVVNVDLLSKSTYAYNGLQDEAVQNGIGRLFVERNSESDFDYKLEYSIDESQPGYAGFVFAFPDSLDLGEFDTLEVVLGLGDAEANCDIYLKQGEIANYIRICDGSFVNGTDIESQTRNNILTVSIPLSDANFPDVFKRAIEEIGFSANADFTTGSHSFIIYDLRLVKESS